VLDDPGRHVAGLGAERAALLMTPAGDGRFGGRMRSSLDADALGAEPADGQDIDDTGPAGNPA
jgi:hypothetical protein